MIFGADFPKNSSVSIFRFLPPGSYLDGRELGAKNLARIMNDVIANKTKYYDFFRWRNHFSYNETSENADVCKLCEVLNDDQMVNTVSVWQNFREWWNGAQYKENCSWKKNYYDVWCQAYTGTGNCAIFIEIDPNILLPYKY